MARSTTIRLPGTDGPDITIERGAFSKPRVTIRGRDVARDPARKDSYPIVMPDGTTRSISIKGGWTGAVVVADDGSRYPLTVGDRQIACIATGAGGEELTGSVAGTGQ